MAGKTTRKGGKKASKKTGPKFTAKQRAQFVGLLRERAEARDGQSGQ